MMRRHSIPVDLRRTRRRSTPLGRLGALLVVIGCASAMTAIIVAGGFVRQTKLDSTTLCRLNAPPPAYSVVLVDGSDRFSTLQAAQVTAAVEREATRLPRYGKLSVFLLSAAHPDQPEEIISVCNPGTAHNADEWLEGPKKLDRIWQNRFRPKLDTAINRLLAAPDSDSSPIMETISAIAHRPDFNAPIPVRRLVVVSDLLQFTPGIYTQYRSGNLWAPFARSALALSADPDLARVDVVVDYIERSGDSRFQGAAHIAFWGRWFRQRNAAKVEFRMPPSSAVAGGEQAANAR